MFVTSFAFCVITFEPIMFQTCSAPQNDRKNFSFVKDTYVDGEKLARNGPKTATYYEYHPFTNTYMVEPLVLQLHSLGFSGVPLCDKGEEDSSSKRAICTRMFDFSCKLVYHQ